MTPNPPSSRVAGQKAIVSSLSLPWAQASQRPPYKTKGTGLIRADKASKESTVSSVSLVTIVLLFGMEKKTDWSQTKSGPQPRLSQATDNKPGWGFFMAGTFYSTQSTHWGVLGRVLEVKS